MADKTTLNYESPSTEPPRHSRLAGFALALGVLAIVLPGLSIYMMSKAPAGYSDRNELLTMALLFLIVPAAIIVSILAMRRTSPSAGTLLGRRQAITGLILSVLALLIYGGAAVVLTTVFHRR